MHIFKTGLIGRAVHQKVEGAVNRTDDGKTFGEILRSLMGNTREKPKTVGYTKNTDLKVPKTSSLNGKTLLYAMDNKETDTTASAVLNSLGLYSGSSSDLKTAADSLSVSVNVLSKLNGTDSETALKQTADFAERYNNLLTLLSSASTSSGYLYSSILKTSASTSSDLLSEAGITITESGKLEFNAENFVSLNLENFLSGIASACTSVSAYSSSVSGDGLLGLYSDSMASDGTSSRLTSLMDLYV